MARGHVFGKDEITHTGNMEDIHWTWFRTSIFVRSSVQLVEGNMAKLAQILYQRACNLASLDASVHSLSD